MRWSPRNKGRWVWTPMFYNRLIRPHYELQSTKFVNLGNEEKSPRLICIDLINRDKMFSHFNMNNDKDKQSLFEKRIIY